MALRPTFNLDEIHPSLYHGSKSISVSQVHTTVGSLEGEFNENMAFITYQTTGAIHPLIAPT